MRLGPPGAKKNRTEATTPTRGLEGGEKRETRPPRTVATPRGRAPTGLRR